MLKPLPTTTQTFRDVIAGGFLYIDKTQYLYQMVRPSKGVYFLARPRRFGKSLMVSTLQEIFRGNRELFRDLWIDSSDYNWTAHPVFRFDFSLRAVKSAEDLKRTIEEYIQQIAEDNNVTRQKGHYQSLLHNLVLQCSQTKQIVILIDEYDKPIIDNLDNIDEARQIRDVLKGFYTVIKGLDQHIRFAFITGISKFSRVGVFSAMNNLEDLTMDPFYATALGFTEAELLSDLQPYIQAFAQQQNSSEAALVEQIRHWYNGFRFVENALPVYNPFSTLLLLKKQRFDNYWFESGTPTFLVNLIKDRQYNLGDLQNTQLSQLAFSTYEIEQLDIVPLLFQTGYLTIKSYDPIRRRFSLGYPNYEVEDAFLTYLLSAFSELKQNDNDNQLWRLIDALVAADIAGFMETLHIFFVGIPYEIQIQQERYYQSIIYVIFTLIGLRINAEVRTNQGRIDAVVEMRDRIYLFEFKVDGSAQEALQQIREKNYFVPYLQAGRPIDCIGVNFKSSTRGIDEWQMETVQPD